MLSPESYAAVYNSPTGLLGIQTHQDKLTHINWLADEQAYSVDERTDSNAIINALDMYFTEGKWDKKVCIKIKATDFQKMVWQALKNIPCGETRTYGELAKELSTSSRAIGQACRTNPVPIFIPCHRVVAKDHIGGFMGKANKLHIKEWLIEHEKQWHEKWH